MTATTALPERAARPRRTAGADRPGVTLPRAVLAEWTKLRSLRSTWALLALVVALGVGLSALTGYGLAEGVAGPGGQGAGPPGAPADTTARMLSSTSLASLLLGVLGALSMSGEYATGTVTASMTAVPRRWPVLVAKAVVLAAVVAPVSFLLSAAALAVGSSFLSEQESVALSDPGVLTALVGNAGYLTAVALLGLGLATLVRSTAGTITLLVALVFIAPPLLPLIPFDWVATAADHFPVTAGQSLTVVGDGQVLGDGEAALTLLGWALVPLLAGAVLLQRRDV